MDRNIKDNSDGEKPLREGTNLILRNLTGSLGHLLDQNLCSGLVQELIGKRQLTKENLNLYLIMLKLNWPSQKRKFLSIYQLMSYLRNTYGSTRKKSEKPEEVRYIRMGSKELRENINKLLCDEVQLLSKQTTGKTRRTHNTTEIKPCFIQTEYHQRFPKLNPKFNPKLKEPLIELKTPEVFVWSEENIITFLENYIYQGRLSLLSQADLDALEKQISEADYPILRKSIENLLEKLGISKNWLLPFFNYSELEMEVRFKAYEILEAKKNKEDDMTRELYSDIKLSEENKKSLEELRRNITKQMEEKQNDRVSRKLQK